MERLKITLKQHTPLIHFQPEQQGAILRATEVKPKLDRFLISYAFGNNKKPEENFETYKKYLIGYKKDIRDKYEDFEGRRAFNYKLKICNVKNLRDPHEIEVNNKKDFPLYFGNMGKSKFNKSKFVFCDTLDIEFISFHNEIIDKIKKYLPEFLMKTNFGQRQSKGFGSFYINDMAEVKKWNKLKYSFEVKATSDDKIIKNKDKIYKEQYALLKKINEFYVSLRAETTKQDPYIKEYALKEQMIWDKDKIKSEYNNTKLTSDYPAYLIKDLLGLSVREEWHKQHFIITKVHSNGEIERFQSPMFFKPIREYQNKFIVYFEGRDIPKQLLDQTFNIKKDGSGDLQLNTPKSFNIDDFIQYVIKNNKDKSIEIKINF